MNIGGRTVIVQVPAGTLFLTYKYSKAVSSSKRGGAAETEGTTAF